MSENKYTERFNPDCEAGLSSKQVKQRIDEHAVNITTDNTSITIKEIIFTNVFTYFNLIFIIFAVLLLLAREYRGLTFMPIIIANTLIGIVQQIRSKRTLDKLNMLNSPKARLVRDGKIVTLPAESAVLDDIAVFYAGNQIYADAIIMSGEVQVNESLLTGESDEIAKSAGDTLMSGSFIVSGTCRAKLDKIGDDSYIASLSAQAKQMDKREHSQMMSDLNKLIKIVGIIIIPIGIIMFCQQFFTNSLGISESVSRTIAALLGMIPEGLYLLASVALALSVMKLARRRVIVHDLSCVETLARVDVLCVDKTGTITDNNMEVSRLISVGDIDSEKLRALISDFASSMPNDNLTMMAIKKHFTHGHNQKASKVIAFSSSLKYSAAILGGQTYVLGAPEFILRKDYSKYKSITENYMQQGFRAVLFAKYPSCEIKGALTEKAEPLGFILLRNPIRENAIETFRYFEEQGVNIKVISGDNPVTASEIAAEAGIKNADKYIDLSNADEANIDTIANEYTVFGRVSPQMKRSLVHALQNQGHTVAMTGDGVNDVLALKDADCSIAMASGSEAAENVAQIVLLDSDFSCMPDILLEGRRVVNNIERSAGLFLIKNIFSLLLAVFSMISFFSYPLKPQQVSLINVFTIGAPAFLLALEPNKKLIKGRFLTNAIQNAIPAAFTNFIVIAAMVSYCSALNLSNDIISTAATCTLAVTGLVVLVKISFPFNIFKGTILAAMAVGFILSAHYMRWWFSILKMNFEILKLVAIFSIIAVILFISINMLIAFLKNKYTNKAKKKTQLS